MEDKKCTGKIQRRLESKQISIKLSYLVETATFFVEFLHSYYRICFNVLHCWRNLRLKLTLMDNWLPTSRIWRPKLNVQADKCTDSGPPKHGSYFVMALSVSQLGHY